MKRIIRIAITIALFALLPSLLMAQGENPLEDLASALAKLVQRQDNFEARLIEIENRLNIVTVTTTHTPAPTGTPVPTGTPTPTQTPTVTLTPTPTFTPTPLPAPEDFKTVRTLYRTNKSQFNKRLLNQRVYIQGKISFIGAKLTGGYIVQFQQGSLLDLACHLPANVKNVDGILAVGKTVIVYGYAQLDPNFFGDDDLLIRRCKVAPPSAALPQPTPTTTSTPTPAPTPTPRPTPAPVLSVQAGATQCLYEDIRLLEFEDLSTGYSNRFSLRLFMPVGCNEDDALFYAEANTFRYVIEAPEIDAISYIFFCNRTDIREATADVVIIYAPEGDWSKAGKTPSGDHSTHEHSFRLASNMPCQ